MKIDEIYQQHADLVWRTLCRMGLSKADAEDAMQEIFLRVHCKLDQFERRCALSTWIVAICLNVNRDRQKRAHRRREVSDDESVARQVDPGPDAGQAAEQRQQLALLRGILERMKPDQREVFILFELEGMSAEEIAGILVIPKNTVYSRLRLAREDFHAAVARMEAREPHRKPRPEPSP